MCPNKYAQPYSSRHVINNTKDFIRSEEPNYIRQFPRLLYALYKKQTPYAPAGANTNTSTRSPHEASTNKSTGSRTPSPVGANQQQAANQQFQTLGPNAGKSPSNNMSTMPSDFEHIFHYSETQ